MGKKPITTPPPVRYLSYQIGAIQGQGARPYQEDSFGFVNGHDVTEMKHHGLLAMVADGMGGLDAGKEVSQQVVSDLSAYFQSRNAILPSGTYLRDMTQQVNEQLFHRFSGCGGSTMIACSFFHGILHWVSVGDSFLFLKRGNMFYQVNEEQNFLHQLYREAIESEDLSVESLSQDPDGPRLTQFMGKEDLVLQEYSVRGLPLMDGDILLLCSDGVGGVLPAQMMSDCLTLPPQEACQQMEQEIIRRGNPSQDNFTALVIACRR